MSIKESEALRPCLFGGKGEGKEREGEGNYTCLVGGKVKRIESVKMRPVWKGRGGKIGSKNSMRGFCPHTGRYRGKCDEMTIIPLRKEK